MAKTINDLVLSVKKGEYPDVERPQGERILTMPPVLISNYSIILANCLLNDIPAETAEKVFPARAALYDQIIEAVNMSNFGRVNKLVALIDSYCKESMENADCWPKRREANNICQWAADYFAWDDATRQEFFGAEEQHNTEEVESREPVEENIPNDAPETVSEPAPIGSKRQEVKDKKPVAKPPKRIK